jgi:hypothetical protein
MIRLDLPGYGGADSLEPSSWDEWLRAFDDDHLALVHQDETAAGARSNFNRLVSRDSASHEGSHGSSHASAHDDRASDSDHGRAHSSSDH